MDWDVMSSVFSDSNAASAQPAPDVAHGAAASPPVVALFDRDAHGATGSPNLHDSFFETLDDLFAAASDTSAGIQRADVNDAAMADLYAFSGWLQTSRAEVVATADSLEQIRALDLLPMRNGIVLKCDSRCSQACLARLIEAKGAEWVFSTRATGQYWFDLTQPGAFAEASAYSTAAASSWGGAKKKAHISRRATCVPSAREVGPKVGQKREASLPCSR